MLSVHNGIPDPGNNSQTFFSIQGDDEPGLGELGICLGDLFPSISENYPKKRAFLDIRATRAPSILFSAKKGGNAHVDAHAEADLIIEGTSTKVGTLGVQVQIDLVLHLRGQQAFGSGEISILKLMDESGTMGVDQESLDNLSILGKGLIEKQVNSALKKGIPIHITQSPSQPATFYNLQIKIVEHGLYVAADLTISQALLGTLTYAGSCYKF
ncbi:hypothetical protein PRIPAC_80935 [Pristionchus pacificus]|uniref:BPI2 domain-containing protein n=1 Tax=Pristionchus pacificus TaxID=54126 RepID=A0A2A6CPK8_PRIPA|nr:hypothetical protein PRIPAC_80935 [Pristionchus pacificus]|eukprot:PDM80124.1 hypothetical protein PRIPAC_32703 [Pristionchus pacificus]